MPPHSSPQMSESNVCLARLPELGRGAVAGERRGQLHRRVEWDIPGGRLPTRPEAIHRAPHKTLTLRLTSANVPGLSCPGAAAVPGRDTVSPASDRGPPERGVPRDGTATLAARHTLWGGGTGEHTDPSGRHQHPARAVPRLPARLQPESHARARTAERGHHPAGFRPVAGPDFDAGPKHSRGSGTAPTRSGFPATATPSTWAPARSSPATPAARSPWASPTYGAGTVARRPVVRTGARPPRPRPPLRPIPDRRQVTHASMVASVLPPAARRGRPGAGTAAVRRLLRLRLARGVAVVGTGPVAAVHHRPAPADRAHPRGSRRPDGRGGHRAVRQGRGVPAAGVPAARAGALPRPWSASTVPAPPRGFAPAPGALDTARLALLVRRGRHHGSSHRARCRHRRPGPAARATARPTATRVPDPPPPRRPRPGPGLRAGRRLPGQVRHQVGRRCRRDLQRPSPADPGHHPDRGRPRPSRRGGTPPRGR